MAGLVIMLIVGFFMISLGLIIWKFQLVNLIAGYDPDKVKDPKKLAKWVGQCLMCNGAIAWLMGVISQAFENKNSGLIVVVIFFSLSSISMAITLAGMQKYLK